VSQRSAAQRAELSVFFATCLLLAGDACGQTYSVQDLGVLVDLPPRLDAKPYEINASGTVVAANVTNGAYRGVVYNSSWKDVGTLGGSESLAVGIDDLGHVVGSAQTTAGTNNAFLWTPGATDGVAGNPQMKSLGTMGGPSSQAYAINNMGQVTGYSDVPGGQQHAFRYSGGTLTDIGQISGLPNSFGYGINAAGHVAGTAYDANYVTPHAFYFNGTSSVDLGVSGGRGALALTINNSDHIAGYLTTASAVDHAFMYSSGTTTDLGTLGGTYSYGLGINNSNVVIGGSYVDTNNSIYHAFRWANGTMTDLNNQLDQTGAGWTLIEARAINDAGQITGTGLVGGVNHAFRLNPVSNANPAPRITSVKIISSNLVLSFTTIAARHYNVQTNGTASSTGWADSTTNILGTGGTVTVTNSVTSSRGFYRVTLLVP
jgi:probable HAF family extracellular repeat protein